MGRLQGRGPQGQGPARDEQRPRGISAEPNLFAGKTRLWYGRWDYKYLMAREGTAPPARSSSTRRRRRATAGRSSRRRGTASCSSSPDDGRPARPMKMWATEELAKSSRRWAARTSTRSAPPPRARAFRPVPLGVTMSLAFTNATCRVRSPGTSSALLRGADPKRRGRGRDLHARTTTTSASKAGAKPVRTRSTTARSTTRPASRGVLAVARAFAACRSAPAPLGLLRARGRRGAGPPRLRVPREASAGPARAHRRERQHRRRSAYYGKTRDVGMIGLGKSSLDADLRRARAPCRAARVHGDEFPDRGAFYRSDQFNFAQVGVPAAYLKTGTDVDRQARGLGQGAGGGVPQARLPPAVGRVPGELGLLGRRRGPAARLLARLPRRGRARACRAGTKATSSRRRA